MSNEFDYKEYLKNNPLLSEDMEEISEMSEKEADKMSDEIEDLADDEELGNLDKVVSSYLKKHPDHKEMETKIRQIASRFVD
jgi:uncharacterized protein YneF (UPF0154 family)